MPEIGTGHIRRCAQLADYHRRQYGSEVRVVVRDYPGAIELLQTRGISASDIELIDPHLSETQVMERVLESFEPHVCVFDLLEVDVEAVRCCQRAGVVTVTLDDVGAALATADIAVNAIREHAATCYSGPDYLVLPDDAMKPSASQEGPGPRLSLLVSTGGYDPGHLAARVVSAVRELPAVKRIRVVAADAEAGTKCHMLAGRNDDGMLNVVHSVPELGSFLAQSDLAIVSGGLTLFEAMRRGVPSIVVAQYEHQADTARRYAARGAVVAIGEAGDDFEQRVRAAVAELVSAPAKREQLSRAARRLVDGGGLKRVANLIRMCELLEWDTQFFGRRIADIKPLRLTERIMDYVLARCREWGIECLYYQSDCHHAPSVQLAEQHGFHFVDIRLTFERYVSKQMAAEPSQRPAGVEIRESRPQDMPALKEIASDSYLDSRYYFDARFPRERCAAFYTEWIEKCANGLVDRVLVAERGSQPVGYVACRRVSPFVGSLDLVGVHSRDRQTGIGRALVEAALSWCAVEGMERVQVVTQGRNHPSQRLYQRCGFLTKHTRLWYHKWFD